MKKMSEVKQTINLYLNARRGRIVTLADVYQSTFDLLNVNGKEKIYEPRVRATLNEMVNRGVIKRIQRAIYKI